MKPEVIPVRDMHQETTFFEVSDPIETVVWPEHLVKDAVEDLIESGVYSFTVTRTKMTWWSFESLRQRDEDEEEYQERLRPIREEMERQHDRAALVALPRLPGMEVGV